MSSAQFKQKTESEDESNELQVVENEQYFIILPIGYKAKPSRILSYFSYQTVSSQLPKPTSKERESTKGIDT